MTEVSRMTATTALMAPHPAERPLRKFLFSNRAALGSLAVFAVMLLVFFVANPRVFSSWGLYAAVLTTLPVALFNLQSGSLGSVDYGALLSGVVAAALPCVALFLVLQRYYVRGFLRGALKG